MDPAILDRRVGPDDDVEHVAGVFDDADVVGRDLDGCPALVGGRCPVEAAGAEHRLETIRTVSARSASAGR